MDYADIKLITGDQGQGKSNTLVAYAVDDYFDHAYVVSPDGTKRFPVQKFYPYLTCKCDDKAYKVPDTWKVESRMRIFANFHLYGIRYMYAPAAKVIEYINTDLLVNCWILWDESSEVDARNSMTLAGKIEAWFGAGIRKRNAHFGIASQFESQVERRYRAFATSRILCSYNKKRGEISLDIKQKGEPKKQVTYFCRQYWPFYRTEERIAIPEHSINKALASLRS